LPRSLCLDPCREGGDAKKRRPFFPADKQFLVTRNGEGYWRWGGGHVCPCCVRPSQLPIGVHCWLAVKLTLSFLYMLVPAVPCLRRAADVAGSDANNEFAVQGEEDWVATHHDVAAKGGAGAAAEEDIPSIDDAGAGPSSSKVAKGADDDVPDISELELKADDDEVWRPRPNPHTHARPFALLGNGKLAHVLRQCGSDGMGWVRDGCMCAAEACARRSMRPSCLNLRTARAACTRVPRSRASQPPRTHSRCRKQQHKTHWPLSVVTTWLVPPPTHIHTPRTPPVACLMPMHVPSVQDPPPPPPHPPPPPAGPPSRCRQRSPAMQLAATCGGRSRQTT
jgi:hypothetical protein